MGGEGVRLEDLDEPELVRIIKGSSSAQALGSSDQVMGEGEETCLFPQVQWAQRKHLIILRVLVKPMQVYYAVLIKFLLF